MATTAGIIRQNLADIRGRIDATAQGRAIRLVCVTKYANPDWIGPLLEAGATDLGENLLPNAAVRFDSWTAAYGSFTRHLLGAQQSRKVKLIPECCDLFQALDRADMAERLERAFIGSKGPAPAPPRDREDEDGRAEAPAPSIADAFDVLLEVNIDAEPQKAGFAVRDLAAAALHITQQCPSLNLRGLMCIPKFRQPGESDNAFERRTRQAYTTMAQLFARIGTSLPPGAQWDTLSMGMSQDFTWAIEEGTTMVRIGSALFAGLEG